MKTQELKLKKFWNTDPSFGHSGPYEAYSAENLADQMGPCLLRWAVEKSETATAVEINGIKKEMRQQFISALTTVAPSEAEEC